MYFAALARLGAFLADDVACVEVDEV